MRTFIRSAFTMMYSQSKSLISNNVLRPYCFINFPTKYKHKYLFDMKWLPGMLSWGFEGNLQQHPNRRHDECCRAEFLIYLESKQSRVCRLSRLRTSHLFQDENIEKEEKGRQISFARQRSDLPSSDNMLDALLVPVKIYYFSPSIIICCKTCLGAIRNVYALMMCSEAEYEEDM